MGNSIQPQKELTAVCGLFCPSCIIYISSRESDEKRMAAAARFGMPVEEFHCDGCRSGVRIAYCDDCTMYQCAAEKGIDFCGECEEYPCGDLKQFQSERPHRLELWQNQQRIKEVGWEKWFAEMTDHYSCPQCGTINAAYHLACRVCGAMPGSAYVEEHMQELKAYYAERK